MITKLCLLFVYFLFAFTNSHQDTKQHTEPADDRIIETVKSAIAKIGKDEFSGCVLIRQNGKVIFRKSYGFANREKGIESHPEMSYDIGSVTKPVVAAAILRMIQADKLKLDSKLGEILKIVPGDKSSITIEQLLAHTSGLPRHYDLKSVNLNSRDETVKALLKIKLSNAPGKVHTYSNSNYFLLAAILDQLGDDSYEDVVREEVFEPLKMKSGEFTNRNAKTETKTPLRYKDSKAIGSMIAWHHTWGHRGATGMLGNVDDMARFIESTQSDKLFDKRTRKEWLTVRQSSYALGWYVLHRPDYPKVIMHSGSSPGSRALIAYSPDTKTTLVVLMNDVKTGTLHEWSIYRAVFPNRSVTK